MALTKFKVVKVVPGVVGTPIGMVDLRNITDEVAEKLVKLKCPYLEPLEEVEKGNKKALPSS